MALSNKVRTLIVDDSVVYRSQIKAALENTDRVTLVGVAANGKIALEKIYQSDIDLLILDLEMPEVSGLEVLKRLKEAHFSGKILVFSAFSQRGAGITLEALHLGATDFLTKPGPDLSTDKSLSPSEKIRSLLVPKIEALFPETFDEALKKESSAKPLEITKEAPFSSWSNLFPGILVIGSSTGGPTLLEKIFSDLKQVPHCPFLIVQHMPPVFTTALAHRLSKMSGLDIIEATHGIPLEKGRGYIAPGDFHMTISGSAKKAQIILDQNPQMNSVRPAVDPLFESAAKIYKASCLGLILTGMGADGKVGCQKIKEHGGHVIIQSEASCVVFGMPGAVKSVNAYDQELEPAQITEALKEKIFNLPRIAV